MALLTRGWLIGLAAALVMLAAPHDAAAQGGGASFTVRPARYDPDRPETKSYFVYDAQAGQHFSDEVRVINTGDQPGIVRLYAVDATTGQNGGPVYLQGNDQRKGVGGWIALATNEIRLAPGEEQLISFSVVVPPDGRAGEHLGGIVAEGATVTSQPDGSNFAVNLQVRSVVAVQMNLPGPRQDKLEITGLRTEVSNGLQLVVVSLRNAGNYMVKGSGSATILAASGEQVAVVPIQLDYVLPGDHLDLAVPVPGQALAAGQYRASVALTIDPNISAVTFDAPIEVTAAQVEEIYTAQTQLPPPVAATGEGWVTWLPLIFGAISVLLFAVYLGGRLGRGGARTPAGRRW